MTSETNNKDKVRDESASKDASSPKRRIKRLKLVLLVLVLILTAEIGLRIFADHDSKFNVVIGAGKEFDPERRVRLKKNYHRGSIHTNSKGILGRDFDAIKPTGSFRILNLGDSCSFWPPDRNYSMVMEERLRELKPDLQIDVINASVPGYASDQARVWYERELVEYDHDILVIYLGWNDMGQYHPDGLEYKLVTKGYLEQPSILQRAFLSSYILRSFYIFKGYWERSRPVSLEALNAEDARRYDAFYPDHFETNVKAIIELAKSRDRRVFLLNYAGLVTDSPTELELQRMHFPRNQGKSLPKYQALKRSYVKALAKVADETKTPMIDIESMFDAPERRNVFFDSVHFNREGAEVIGKRVADSILPYVQ